MRATSFLLSAFSTLLHLAAELAIPELGLIVNRHAATLLVHLEDALKGAQHLGIAWMVCLGSTPSREHATFQPLEIIGLGFSKVCIANSLDPKKGAMSSCEISPGSNLQR